MNHSAATSRSCAAGACSERTRTVILDTAERLFGESGVEGTSVRDIIRAAGVNLGAINYYFGTKEALAVAVFMRRLEPLNGKRLRRLDEVEQRAAGNPPELEELLAAFFEPVLEEIDSGELSMNSFLRLISRCFQEPNPEIKVLLKRHFENVCSRFDNAILRAVPSLRPDEVFWRMNFLIGALNQALDMWSRFDLLPIVGLGDQAKIERPSKEDLISQLIAFAAGGIRARSVWSSKDSNHA